MTGVKAHASAESRRGAVATLLLGVVFAGTAACAAADQPGTAPSGEVAVGEPFDMEAISQIKALDSLTLWRVGQHALGPGRDPEEPIAVVAANNRTGWAHSIDGDGRFDNTNLPGTPPTASERDAQAVLVRLVERATGREVNATWVDVDADTWTATASFAD